MSKSRATAHKKPSVTDALHAEIERVPLSRRAPLLKIVHAYREAIEDEDTEQARFRRHVEAGIAAADRGEFATDAQVRAEFAKWGVKP